MKPRAGYWLAFVVLFASLGFAQGPNGTWNDPNKADVVETFSHRGSLTVLVPKTSQRRVNYDFPWGVILNAFKSDFPNFNLDLQILETNELAMKLNPSGPDPHFPDVAFVDNDRDLSSLLHDKSVVMMWGRPRFDRGFNGMWVIFRQAKNYAVGKAFFLWLAQSPQWKPMRVATDSIAPADIAAVQAISKEAVQDFTHGYGALPWPIQNAAPGNGASPRPIAYAAHGLRSLESIMDPEAGGLAGFGDDRPGTFQSIQPQLTFGNSRLAFVLLAEVGQKATDSPMPPLFGMAHTAVILRKLDNGWKVLCFLPDNSNSDLEGLLGAFDLLGLDDGPPEAVPKVTLLAPADHAQLPPRSNPILEWTQVDPNLAAYVMEVQTSPKGRDIWSPSMIRVISPDPNEALLRVRSPLEHYGPQRLRIWAINKSGMVTTSDWRNVDSSD